MNLLDDLWPRDIQQIVISLKIFAPFPKALATIGRLLQLIGLDHRAHGTVDNDDPFPEESLQFRGSIPINTHSVLEAVFELSTSIAAA